MSGRGDLEEMMRRVGEEMKRREGEEMKRREGEEGKSFGNPLLGGARGG